MIGIVFDTETTGKPLNYKASMKDVNNWPRITQLAWQKINIQTGEVLNEYQSLIKPDGWVIPKEQFFIDNNMSTERCEQDGLPALYVLELLCEDINTADIFAAHNIAFDLNVCGAELIRANLKAKSLQKICTMEATTELCKLPGQYGKYKWPKLIELHNHLFGCDFVGAHDALDDVRATAACLVELVKRNIIKLS